MFYAALIGIGCNIGIHKLAGTAKGISLNKIENVANWYINKEGLYKANHQIIQAIDKLSLPNLLLGGSNIKHGSSDGMQTEITQDSLNSTQSYKYTLVWLKVFPFTVLLITGVYYFIQRLFHQKKEKLLTL
ncbi:Tn3 family transposase [Francisella noatunensis]